MMLSTEPTSVAGASTASASDTPNEPAIALAMPDGSSVTCTNPSNVWISRSSKPSPAASRSHASF